MLPSCGPSGTVDSMSKQPSQQELPFRPDPQGLPGGHLSASKDSSSEEDSLGRAVWAVFI